MIEAIKAAGAEQERGMSEKPILFSAPMVRAILADAKTQTRRIVKPQPDAVHDGAPYWHIGDYRAWQYTGETDVCRMGTGNPLPCRYDAQRLWVRETLGTFADGSWCYSADCVPVMVHHCDESAMRVWAHHKTLNYCPSIHMPRWASRITLEVTGLRVERLQEITEADAIAEGVSQKNPDFDTEHTFEERIGLLINGYYSAKNAYAELWETINGKGSWTLNPWVFVVSFRRVESGAAQERARGTA